MGAARRALLLVAVLTAGAHSPAAAQNRAAMEAELEQLRADVRVPAMSAAVVEAGTLVWVRHFGLKQTSADAVVYPVGALTQSFAAAAALRLAERGRLSLDAQVDGQPRGVLVRHLLSHTAAGTPGTRYQYSNALFRVLERPLAHAAGTSFAQALRAGVVKPAGLRHTKTGPAISAVSGLESTVEDLGALAASLEKGDLLSSASVNEMFRPARQPGGRPSPFALGWFVQQIGGDQVRWQFSEEEGASGLIVNVPRRRVTFALLSRSARLNAPFHLRSGDLRWSPAALAFLTRWTQTRVELIDARTVMVKALAALGRNERAAAVGLVQKASVLAPPLVQGADLALLTAFARSGDQKLRDYGRRIADRLLEADPDDPRVLLELAALHAAERHPQEADALARRILAGRQATPEVERAARDLLGRQ